MIVCNCVRPAGSPPCESCQRAMERETGRGGVPYDPFPWAPATPPQPPSPAGIRPRVDIEERLAHIEANLAKIMALLEKLGE